MEDTEPIELPADLRPVARTEIADAGAGTFRSASGSFPSASEPAAIDRRPVLAPVAALSLLGVFGLYLKFEIMGPLWTLAARMHGNSEYDLSGLERLGFYFDDLLINFILVPLAGALLAGLMSRSLRGVFFSVVTLATAFLYFFQLRAYSEIGQYVSAPLMVEAFVWAIHNPDTAGDYLSAGSVLKFSLLLLAAFFLLAGESVFSPRTTGIRACLAQWHRRLIGLLAVGLPATAVVLLPFSFAHYPEETYLRHSAVGRVLTALAGSEDDGSFNMNLSFAELMGEFRRQTATPVLETSDPRVGAEKGADILVFVLETTPGAILDVVGNGRKLPGIGRIYERSFLGQQHYSTYPYTSDALYSLLSGLYPQGRRRLLEPEDIHLPGLMRALDPREYVRVVYAPDLYGAERDDRMFHALGADRAYYAAADAGGAARAEASARASRLVAEWERAQPDFDPQVRKKLAERLALDLQTLAQLKKDICKIKKAGRRFCALFLPQVGHGPWLDLHGRKEIADRGRDLAFLQDEWLAEILDLLAANGWLDATIVVFTADHGVRTREEDPSLPIGRLSSRMLEVPLLIHAPRALRHSVTLSSPTSHIDIAPTVLALLGETAGADSMQGVPVWQRTEAGRIFLLGAQYAGADGFTQHGSFYMHHLLADAAFASDRFAFADRDVLAPEDERGEFVRRSLRQATNIQSSIVRRLLREEHTPRQPVPD